MRFTVTLIIFLIAAVGIAIFAAQNPMVLPVRFFHWEVQTSLIVVIVAAAATGGLFIGAVNIYRHLLTKLRQREAANQIRRLEAKKDELTLENERLRLELNTLEESLKQMTSGEGEREEDHP
ncbi:MAG: lipopolysaccharide assembly protein LapA domain-containing protein [Bacillota bacterium]